MLFTECCGVWWATTESLRPSHALLLDHAESHRRSRFVHTADRDRFTLAAALLRLVVGSELGMRPKDLRIDRACPQCGRPHGAPKVLESNLNVSVSHSGARVVVAVSGLGKVGIDIEETTTDLDFRPLLPLVLAPEEADVRSREDFFTYWTRKESVVKSTGEGLLADMTSIVVAAPGNDPHLIRFGDRRITASMADLRSFPGYVGALTVLSPQLPRLIEHDGDALLERNA